MSADPSLPRALLEAVCLHARDALPSEACGVILEGPEGTTLRRLTNAYDRFHARDPRAWPRSSRTAFLAEPAEWIALDAELEASGGRIAWLYHSHVNGPAELSADDLAYAAPGGSPLAPGLLIVSLAADQPVSCGLFRWQNGPGGSYFEREEKSCETEASAFVK